MPPCVELDDRQVEGSPLVHKIDYTLETTCYCIRIERDTNMNDLCTGNSRNHILLVDDDPIVIKTLRLGLLDAGYHVDVQLDGNSALSSFQLDTPDLAIVDVMLPDIMGTDLAARMMDICYRPIIILSEHSNAELVNSAIDNGVFGYLVKPLSAEQLGPSIETALARFGEIQQRVAEHFGESGLNGMQIDVLLDRFSIGLIIVDDKHSILYQNKAAKSLTDTGQLVASNGGRLVAAQSSHGPAFNRALRSALGHHGEPSMGAMTMADASGRTIQVWARLLNNANSVDSQCAIVTLLDVSQPTPAPEPLLRALYGLTRKECRLTAALLNGQTIDQYCRSNFISPNTARTHLKSIYRKTNTNRQVDLVRVLSRLLGGMSPEID